MEMNTLWTSILLAVEMNTLWTSILLAVEMNTLCTPFNNIKTKAQMFLYRSLLAEQNRKVFIWSAYCRNETRTFLSVLNLFNIESERFGEFLNFENETRTKAS
jgi:hypothetical protein